MQCLNTRRTIRQYTADPIPKYDVEKIVNAALRAPTARNIEDVNIVAVTNKDKIAEISKICSETFPPGTYDHFAARINDLGVKDPITCDAPCILFFYTNERANDRNYSFFHTGAQAMSAMVAAKDLGYDSMCLGIFRVADTSKIEAALGIPAGTFLIGLAIGKAIENPIVKTKVIRSEAKYIE